MRVPNTRQVRAQHQQHQQHEVNRTTFGRRFDSLPQPTTTTMDARVRKRLRKWRNEVLDQLQRRTEDLPVFVKGHAAVTRGRALLYYGASID